MGSFKGQGRRSSVDTDEAFEQWVQAQIALCAAIERNATRHAVRRP
jgi:hypothetical protein